MQKSGGRDLLNNIRQRRMKRGAKVTQSDDTSPPKNSFTPKHISTSTSSYKSSPTKKRSKAPSYDSPYSQYTTSKASSKRSPSKKSSSPRKGRNRKEASRSNIPVSPPSKKTTRELRQRSVDRFMTGLIFYPIF